MAVTWSDFVLRNPPVAADDAVRSVEAALGARFPSDFLAVARCNQGRTPTPCCYRLPDGTRSVFNHLLHFEESPPASNYVEAWRDLRDLLPERVIPFAPDPGGNYLCFDFRESETDPRVVFWAHDIVDAPLQPVAESFSELLDTLSD
jgi:SMI1 / KNR4 family (SUKH-1)